MTELLTSAQMRAIEQAAIASGQVTGLELMERAGTGVVEAIFEEWPTLAAPDPGRPCRAVVLCGPGNNGGDGFVVARLLRARGWGVEVFLHGDPERLPPDARANCDLWRASNVIAPLQEKALFSSQANRSPAEIVVVDALFGTGLTRPLDGATTRLLDGIATTDSLAHSRRVAVDVPSGLCADSGRGLWAFEPAQAELRLTVTFHRPKLGHYLSDGPRLCGSLSVKGIGLPDLWSENIPAGGSVVRSLEAPTGSFAKDGQGHKFDYGHALILSGAMGRSGAARLAARGALRIGAGLVTVAAPGDAMPECAAQLTAIMLRRCDDAEDLADLLEDSRINALCLGPGLGLEDRAANLIRAACGGLKTHPTARGRGMVLDADALTLVAEHRELFGMLTDRCVLTPHAGEFARLFPDCAGKLDAAPTSGPARSRVGAARDAAKRAGCVVLFKGPDTVIADPSGRCSVNAAIRGRAAPWLATAGSGDVLAGMIAGLLARGLPPMRAAETAAWLHVEAARSFGPGLVAEDLPETLPGVFRDLGTRNGRVGFQPTDGRLTEAGRSRFQ